MMRLLVFLSLLAAVFFGFWVEKRQYLSKNQTFFNVDPGKKFPLEEEKSFAIVIYACNHENWCERTLRSVFEQEYQNYRVIFVDDASADHTYEKAKDFILTSSQEEKVILTRNETRIGSAASLYRALDHCSDREIIIPLDAKNWFTTSNVLNRLNAAYQNPDVWVCFGNALDYPSYKDSHEELSSFYAGVFKQIHLQDLLDNRLYLPHLAQLSGGRLLSIEEPLLFSNSACSKRNVQVSLAPSSYKPLAEFPRTRLGQEKADILIFSYNRPLQLYSCLESIQRYMTGFEKLTVLYRADGPQFSDGYQRVKEAFPFAMFIEQDRHHPKRDFKPHVMKSVFDSPSEYILFGADDTIVKDFVDLKLCMEQMEKTGAYGFYLRFGKHIRYCYQAASPQRVPESVPLSSDIYAWDINRGEFDWQFANSLDMTLFRKRDLKKAFAAIPFQTPNSLEFNWMKEFRPKKALGLYFEGSKIVNIPLNIVGKTGNPHMNYLSPEQLLVKFNQGYKIDISSLYKIENDSPHMGIIPELIAR
jgi:glycosyltransferase involved in cell wall biosynthesis